MHPLSGTRELIGLIRERVVMALTSINHPTRCHQPLTGVVQFEMLDGAIVVHCMVSDVALHNRALNDSRPQRDVEALFDVYRAEVERLAATQYERGRANPVVRSAHLAPPSSLPKINSIEATG